MPVSIRQLPDLGKHYTAHIVANVNYSAPVKKRSPAREKLLVELGATVRARRAELGMTMRVLAQTAGVSERFLVQLEAGEGNISVARLEDVAEGLRTTGADLLASASRAAPSTSAPGALAIVGLRGAGKSSIGAAVAERMRVPFIELDELIVREAQMTLSTIFEIHGERYYRNVEREVLRRRLCDCQAVSGLCKPGTASFGHSPQRGE